jgi:hypothetical protein
MPTQKKNTKNAKHFRFSPFPSFRDLPPPFVTSTSTGPQSLFRTTPFIINNLHPHWPGRHPGVFPSSSSPSLFFLLFFFLVFLFFLLTSRVIYWFFFFVSLALALSLSLSLSLSLNLTHTKHTLSPLSSRRVTRAGNCTAWSTASSPVSGAPPPHMRKKNLPIGAKKNNDTSFL